MTNIEREARRRVDEAACLIASAVRLGVDVGYVARAVSGAVAQGAEQYAADAVEHYAKAAA